MKEVISNETSEDRYRVLIDNAPEPVFIFDVETFRFLDFNKNAASFFKLHEEELYDLGPLDLSPKIMYGRESSSIAVKYIYEALEGGNPVFDWIHLDSAGKEIPCEIRLVRFPPYDKELIRASVIDKSGRKKLEEALKEREERLKLALRVTGLGTFDMYPAEGKLIWDERMHELFGLSINSPQDRNEYFFSVIHPEDIERVQQNFLRLMGTGSVDTELETEYRIIRKGETRHIISNGFLVRNDNGEVLRFIGTCHDITEARTRERLLISTTEKLKVSEEKFSKSFHRHITPMVIFDIESGTRVDMNQSYLELLGYAADDIKNGNLHYNIWAEPEKRMQAVEAIKRDGFLRNFPADFTTQSGKIINVLINSTPLDIKGRNLGISSFIDITEHKRAEKKLKESEERFSKSFYNNVTPMAIFDIESGARININDSFVKLFGYTREELLSGSLFINNLWVDEDLHKKTIKNLQRDRFLRNMSADFINSSGEIISLIINVVTLDNEGGNLGISTILDVTERKRTEEALQESEEHFRALFEQSNVAFFIYNLEGEFLDVNQRMLDITGYSKEELLGRRFYEMLPDDDQVHAAAKAAFEALLATGSLHFESQGVRKSGEIYPIEISSAIIDIGGKKLIYGSGQDLKERKLAERQKIHARQLEMRNKELEQFAYVASHDLREPLRTVKGFAEVLKKRYEDKLDENADKYLGFISQAASRMDKVIKALLDYSRIGRNKTLNLVDFKAVIGNLQEDLAAQIAETNVKFEIGQLPKINGYETEIRVLFQNLISNAIKFRKMDTTPVVCIDATNSEGFWEFCISDNGIGIAPEYSEKIFVIFQRLHTQDNYEGTGIGLAHCQKIVDLHGGKIWVESQPGEGSKFFFTIPD